MGCSFTAYVNQVRVEKSKDLLRNTDLKLVEIATILGFEYQSYFSKVFEKLSGYSPGKHKEQMLYI